MTTNARRWMRWRRLGVGAVLVAASACGEATPSEQTGSGAASAGGTGGAAVTDPNQPFDPAAPQRLVAPDGAGVDLPAGALQAPDGSPPAGLVKADVYLRVAAGSDVDAMPGGFVGQPTGGGAASLLSFGVLAASFYDTVGSPLELAPGATATITIPALDAGPASVPLWWYDPTQARWVEEGSASWVDGAYVGTVSHFTEWNVDDACTSACIDGVVHTPGGVPASFGTVVARVKAGVCASKPLPPQALSGASVAIGADGTFHLDGLIRGEASTDSVYELTAIIPGARGTLTVPVPSSAAACVPVTLPTTADPPGVAGAEVSVSFSWTIHGAPPTHASCNLLNTSRIAVSFFESDFQEPARVLVSAPCEMGSVTTVPILRSGPMKRTSPFGFDCLNPARGCFGFMSTDVSPAPGDTIAIGNSNWDASL